MQFSALVNQLNEQFKSEMPPKLAFQIYSIYPVFYHQQKTTWCVLVNFTNFLFLSIKITVAFLILQQLEKVINVIFWTGISISNFIQTMKTFGNFSFLYSNDCSVIQQFMHETTMASVCLRHHLIPKKGQNNYKSIFFML